MIGLRFTYFRIIAYAAISIVLLWICIFLFGSGNLMARQGVALSSRNVRLLFTCEDCSGKKSGPTDSSHPCNTPLPEETMSTDNKVFKKITQAQNDTNSIAVKGPPCKVTDFKQRVHDIKSLNYYCGSAILPTGYDTADPGMNFLTAETPGLLGNRMFQVASLLGIAHGQKTAVCLPSNVNLPKYFKLKGVQKMAWTESANWSVTTERCWAGFDSCLLRLPHHNFTVYEYLQSYKYFHPIENKIRDLFTFQEDILKQAFQILDDLWGNESTSLKDIALVGVHARRGDMLLQNHINSGHVVAPSSYYAKAFQWMEDNLPDKTVKFIVVCQDTEWCSANLIRENAKLAPQAPAEVHLALLATCHHVILSTGTFGWWGAWLAGGKAVYYEKYPRENSVMVKGFNRSEFFLPSWVGLA